MQVSFQFELAKRDGVNEQDIKGMKWDIINIDGKATQDLTLHVKSVYDSYVEKGGIVEIVIAGEECEYCCVLFVLLC